MRDAPISQARSPVERFLEHSMVPDPEGAVALVVKDMKITFTVRRALTDPKDTAAFNAKRYRCVKKRLGATHTALDAETGNVHVYNSGQQYDAWPDGTPFGGNRYIDTFVISDEPIVETQAWNASTKWSLDRAGLGSAPL